MGFFDKIPGYDEVKPGYENPFTPDASPIGSNYDWGSFSKGIDWNQTPSIWSEAKSKANKYRDQAERKQRDKETRDSWLGSSTPGTSFGDGKEYWGFSLPQPAPFVVAGTPGEKGWGEKLAGSLIGGTIGFATGGPIGALAGGSQPWFG
jgi:hypothetical protein